MAEGSDTRPGALTRRVYIDPATSAMSSGSGSTPTSDADRKAPLGHGLGGVAASLVGQGAGRRRVAGRVEGLRGDGQVDQAEALVDITPGQRVVGHQVDEREEPPLHPLARPEGPVVVPVGGQQLARVVGQRLAGQAGASRWIGGEGGAGRGLEPVDVDVDPLGEHERAVPTLDDAGGRGPQPVEEVAEATTAGVDVGLGPQQIDGLVDGQDAAQGEQLDQSGRVPGRGLCVDATRPHLEAAEQGDAGGCRGRCRTGVDEGDQLGLAAGQAGRVVQVGRGAGRRLQQLGGPLGPSRPLGAHRSEQQPEPAVPFHTDGIELVQRRLRPFRVADGGLQPGPGGDVGKT